MCTKKGEMMMDNYSREAERALLGLLLINHSKWLEVIEIVSDIDVSDDIGQSNRMIFMAIEKRILTYGMGVEISSNVIIKNIQHEFNFQSSSHAGGAHRIQMLPLEAARLGNQDPLAYAKIIREKAVMRELVRVASSFINVDDQSLEIENLEMKIEERDEEIKHDKQLIRDLVAALHKSECR